jgi:hypothetical protein
MTAQTLARPNAYPANCIRCHARIPAQAGLLARTDDGKWAADHPADCPPKTAPQAPQPHVGVQQDGIYRLPDGTIFKVQIAKQGSGNLYAKRLTIRPCDLGTACKMCHGTGLRDIAGEQKPCLKGKFVYAAGAVHTLRADQRLPEDEARLYGQMYGICCACGADLTDEVSIAKGIGPVCGARYF